MHTLNAMLLLLLQVNRAVDYVGGGTKALVEAKQYQKSKRKWCCCAIVTLLVILIVVIVVVSTCAGMLYPGAAHCIPCVLHAARSRAACPVHSKLALSQSPLLRVKPQHACAAARRLLLSTSCHSSTRTSSERCRSLLGSSVAGG